MNKEEALRLAAQAWCREETKHIPMIPALAEAFAGILLSELAERNDETCEWTIDEDTANTGCGTWTTAWDVSNKYCQFCGKRIKRGEK